MLGEPPYDPRMTKAPKRPRDPNQLAKFIADLATGDASEAPDKSEAQSRGGKIGGAKRAEKLTAEQRAAIASKAAKARWSS